MRNTIIRLLCFAGILVSVFSTSAQADTQIQCEWRQVNTYPLVRVCFEAQTNIPVGNVITGSIYGTSFCQTNANTGFYTPAPQNSCSFPAAFFRK